jgi:hypothetical protein
MHRQAPRVSPTQQLRAHVAHALKDLEIRHEAHKADDAQASTLGPIGAPSSSGSAGPVHTDER